MIAFMVATMVIAFFALISAVIMLVTSKEDDTVLASATTAIFMVVILVFCSASISRTDKYINKQRTHEDKLNTKICHLQHGRIINHICIQGGKVIK